MTHTINGVTVDARPPISTISVNKFNVVFKDSQKLKSIRFNDSIETKKFIDWLVAI